MTKERIKRALQVTAVLLAVLIGLGIGFGGTSRKTASGPQVIMRVLDPSLEQYSLMWQKEVARRFDHATVILVHGGDFVEGQWIVGDWSYRSGVHVRPVTDVVKEAQAADPSRTIVLLACNPGHLQLGIPGVYYAHSSVWCVPDRSIFDLGIGIDQLDDTLMWGKKAPPKKMTIGLDRWSLAPEVLGNIFEFTAE